MNRRKEPTNFARLDGVVAALARRDDRLRKLMAETVDVDGRRFIRASALAAFLGYTSRQSFKQCVDNAQITANTTGVPISTNFVPTTVFDGGEEDLLLSEWATYATVMEANTKLPHVAIAKSFFASLVEHRAKQEETRLRERWVAKKLHKRLHGAAEQAGIQSGLDHAIFDDHGYRGMYQRSINEVESLKGVPKHLKLIDCADHTELAANNLRMSLAADRILERHIKTKTGANEAHFQVGKIMRTAVQSAVGRPPESLPLAPNSINELSKIRESEYRVLGI